MRRSGSNSANGLPKRICSNTMWGDGRWERSPNSSMSKRSTRRWIERKANGSVSVRNPGSLPLAHTDESPCRHASRMRLRLASLSRTARAIRSVQVVTTLVPLSSSATMSSTSSSWVRPARVWPVPVARAMYTQQSAFSSRIASRSVVAATPVGSSPHSSPASTPFLPSSYTRTPTRSYDGSRISSRRARCPVFPVAHWTTR